MAPPVGPEGGVTSTSIGGSYASYRSFARVYCCALSDTSSAFRLIQSELFTAVSPVHAVTALAVIVATAIAVLGQLYHEEKRIPVVEPDALLVFLVVIGGLVMVYRLS